MWAISGSDLGQISPIIWTPPYTAISLVDGGGLRTHFSDPMRVLRSSGYTLSGIYIDDLSLS